MTRSARYAFEFLSQAKNEGKSRAASSIALSLPDVRLLRCFSSSGDHRRIPPLCEASSPFSRPFLANPRLTEGRRGPRLRAGAAGRRLRRSRPARAGGLDAIERAFGGCCSQREIDLLFLFSPSLLALSPSLSPPNHTSAPHQEWKGYIFKIMGGQDKQGFPMKQGVLVPGRVRLLMTPGDACFRGFGRRSGERRRKSVRGCVVSPDLSVLNLVVVKKGAADVPGLTDEEKPRMRGPKRASKIRKLFNLTKDDDVRKYVNTYRRKFTVGEKTHSKAPKIQRLVTPQTLQRKRARKAEKVARVTRSKAEAAEYHKLLVSRLKAARERRSESIAKKRAVRAASVASKEAEPAKK